MSMVNSSDSGRVGSDNFQVMAEMLPLGLAFDFFSCSIFISKILQTIRLVFSKPLHVIFLSCP